MSQINNPIVNARVKYVNGLEMSYTTATTITIAAGAASDSTNVDDIILSSAVVNTNTAVGVNGVDIAAAAASTFYAVFVIGDSTEYKATASLLSLSSTAPSLPSGYDMFRRIGYVLTDSSKNVLKFWQYGHGNSRDMYYDTGIATPAITTSATYVSQSLAAGIPPSLVCEAYLKVDYTANSATNICTMAPYGSTASVGMIVFGYGVAAAQQGMVTVPTALNSTAPSITHKETSSSDALVILVAGYQDSLA
jgi:hypothetical protein